MLVLKISQIRTYYLPYLFCNTYIQGKSKHLLIFYSFSMKDSSEYERRRRKEKKRKKRKKKMRLQSSGLRVDDEDDEEEEEEEEDDRRKRLDARSVTKV